LSLTQTPPTDPTPIFEHFRGVHATQLLTAAVAHFEIFDHLASGAMTRAELKSKLDLED